MAVKTIPSTITPRRRTGDSSSLIGILQHRMCPAAVVSLNRVQRSVRPVQRCHARRGVACWCAPGRPDAAGIAGRGGRPGASARPRITTAPPRGRVRCRVGHPVRPARHRQDHAGLDDLRRHRSSLRGTVGAVGRCQGGSHRDRGRPDGRRVRRPDGAVHRRGAPVLQDAAGRAAGGRRESGGAAGGGHHGEPVVLGRRPAVVAFADPAVAAAERRRHQDRPAARDRRPARAGRRCGGG